ncbi:DUF2630 family protein [Streptomyces sp. 846.5]|uniref:DUF2630 family protein n=1 Tax=Streptacidiphilus sp. EB103A TaxID=3156275 RepID=UPI001062F631|nr:DUF2630 family protein [Streptomyces sp. 846.5]TDT98562.1 uncharacterized protein DUF2630 [Streptomyces sp. 846.5]
MADPDILEAINSMVTAEHELRAKVASGEADPELAHKQLAEIEVQLDQCWDLLRQRRALREFGQAEDAAAIRPASEVEGYKS